MPFSADWRSGISGSSPFGSHPPLSDSAVSDSVGRRPLAANGCASLARLPVSDCQGDCQIVSTAGDLYYAIVRALSVGSRPLSRRAALTAGVGEGERGSEKRPDVSRDAANAALPLIVDIGLPFTALPRTSSLSSAQHPGARHSGAQHSGASSRTHRPQK
jgi:hypothetical protein